MAAAVVMVVVTVAAVVTVVVTVVAVVTVVVVVVVVAAAVVVSIGSGQVRMWLLGGHVPQPSAPTVQTRY